MYQGSCLCGAVKYEITAELKAVTNCHCTMCQKQHGAAFATYASVRKSDLRYLSGENFLSTYNSSDSVLRKFCRVCGSNIEWSGSKKYPEWTSITISTLDTTFNPENIQDIYIESKKCWLK